MEKFRNPTETVLNCRWGNLGRDPLPATSHLPPPCRADGPIAIARRTGCFRGRRPPRGCSCHRSAAKRRPQSRPSPARPCRTRTASAATRCSRCARAPGTSGPGRPAGPTRPAPGTDAPPCWEEKEREREKQQHDECLSAVANNGRYAYHMMSSV